MSHTVEQVEADALQLAIRDRARLVHKLLESLEADEAEDPGEVERAWKAEIDRRVAEYDAGGIELIPAEQVLEEARARLRPR